MKRPSPESGWLVPTGIDPKAYRLGLLGPLALGLSLGIQMTMTGFMLLGPSSSGGFTDQLTDYGKLITRPEHDLSIYVAGALFTLISILVAEWWWRSRLKRMVPEQLTGFMTFSALLQGVAAAASMVLYLLLLSARLVSPESGIWEPAGPFDGFMLLLPGLMALAWITLDMKFGYPHSEAAWFCDRWQRDVSRLLGYAMPVFIILVIGVPLGTWNYLAGQFFMADSCHHMNFFMMGPALAFAHGKAFGAEICSQYGIGWPLVFSAFSHFSAMTYGNLVGLEIVYGCVYYLALFFLLRVIFKHEVWAALGVMLAIYWQIFSGMDRNSVIWLTPSSSMMRHPMDIWFFLTLVMHQRSGRLFWIALAGFLCALGIFLVTETGIYLLVTFLVYWVLQAGLAPGEGRRAGKQGFLFPLIVFYSAAAAALLPLLLCASRGTLFAPAFWRGWIEPLIQYASWGIGALPITELPIVSTVFFVTMLAVYLAVIGHSILRSLRRTAGMGEVLLASVAAYGLALLLNFVSRSHPYNLCHAAVPFAIVLTALMFQCFHALAGGLRHSSFSYVLTGGLILLLLAKPEFLRYPNFLGAFLDDTSRSSLSLMSNPTDISGLPPGAGSFVQEFNGISAAIRTLAPDGKDVAILDSNDTLLYCAAHARPWSRYASLFHMALTKQSLADIRNNLIEHPPKYVVIQGQNSSRPTGWEFVWAPLYEVVKSRYVLRQTVGSYEIWALPSGQARFHDDTGAARELALSNGPHKTVAGRHLNNDAHR